MPDPAELLPPTEPSAPRAEERPKYVTCDGCGCVLTHRGEIITVGEKMRAHRKSEDRIEALTAERDKAIQERDEARSQLSQLARPADAGGKLPWQ